ncbi:MAG: acyl-ACP--UDP-N-acetylglucosamine O-acyltransferase [Solimicrobium sp.]|jgi:UDP-N-acetylglucosamine acyltransferase|nr:acyl-ACP--UDP-N-acetylglucosamine O-acyltransferase [Solimicrobium sp.]
MAKIHATAIIDKGASLDSSVEVGPYSVIGPHVRIDAGTKISSHVIIEGHTKIGCDNTFFQFSSIGSAPQDKKYNGEPTSLEIGDRNTVREFCSFNVGTIQDAGVTTIGHDNLMMAYVHIAHDCKIGSHTIFANNATLAGHVEIADWVILGGFAAVHQFCKVGAHAMLGMNTSLTQDVPPFVMLSGNPAAVYGLNLEGLKRRGFSREQINGIRHSYKLLYKSGLTLAEAKVAIHKAHSEHPLAQQHIHQMQVFLDRSTRGLIR